MRKPEIGSPDMAAFFAKYALDSMESRPPLVYISIPLDLEGEILPIQLERGINAMLFAMKRKCIPLSPSNMYDYILLATKSSYKAGVCSHQLISLCDEVWVFPGKGGSKVVSADIQVAVLLGKPIRVFDDECREVSPDVLFEDAPDK